MLTHPSLPHPRPSTSDEAVAWLESAIALPIRTAEDAEMQALAAKALGELGGPKK